MHHRPGWTHVVISLAVIAAVAIAVPAFGVGGGVSKAVRKAIRSEVAKQIGKARGPAGPSGRQGLTGANGTARAYADLDPGTCSGAPLPICTVGSNSKGVTSIIREATGEYCVIAPGISSNTEPAAVGVDWDLTASPEGNASAMFESNNACGAPGFDGFEVRTEREPSVAVRNAADTGSTNVSGLAVQADDVGFVIVIP